MHISCLKGKSPSYRHTYGRSFLALILSLAVSTNIHAVVFIIGPTRPIGYLLKALLSPSNSIRFCIHIIMAIP